MMRGNLPGAWVILAVMVLIGHTLSYGDVIYVAGDITGIWSADSVIVTDSIYVPSGNSLIIEPGVKVLFRDLYSFKIRDDAILRAVGTEADMIEFGPLTDGYYMLAIEFINSSNQSIIEHCRIQFAVFSAINLTNSSITIRNCTFENNTTSPGWSEGGAISAFSGSDALIENNTFNENWAYSIGGAIFCFASSPVVRGNLFESNRAGPRGGANGGAIACFNQSHPLIINNSFINNEAYPTSTFPPSNGQGGAIFCSDGCIPVIAGNYFNNNRVFMGGGGLDYSGGGAVFAYSASPIISNNLFVENGADDTNGGAIFLANSRSNVINNTFVGNWAADSGGAIYTIYSDSARILNSILYNNIAAFGPQICLDSSTVEVSYCDIEGAWPGPGNIDVDPVFRNPAGGDYHLQDSIICGNEYLSPCIDQGCPAYEDIMLDCTMGLGTELCDMGAYGGGDSTLVGINEIAPRIPHRSLSSFNYPNPFNARTTIEYDLPGRSEVKLEIFDIQGRRVDLLVNGKQDAGHHRVLWNGNKRPSGIYIYRIRMGAFTETKNMLLLK